MDKATFRVYDDPPRLEASYPVRCSPGEQVSADGKNLVVTEEATGADAPPVGTLPADVIIRADSPGFIAAPVFEPPKWRLVLTPLFALYHPRRPCWWFRLWQRLLLGWTWEPLP